MTRILHARQLCPRHMRQQELAKGRRRHPVLRAADNHRRYGPLRLLQRNTDVEGVAGPVVGQGDGGRDAQ